MKIKSNTYSQIISFFNDSNKEQGGILGVNDQDVICAFYGDKTGSCTNDTYEPDIDTLNRVILEWYNKNIYFIGLIHSHIGGCTKLSKTDINYALEIYNVMESDAIIFPIVIKRNNSVCINNFKYSNNQWTKDLLEIVD